MHTKTIRREKKEHIIKKGTGKQTETPKPTVFTLSGF